MRPLCSSERDQAITKTNEQGRPFVGRAGQLLDRLIELIGLRRPDVYITNIVKCRPPENRDPLPYELAACRPYLERQISLLNPEVIVTLGRHSLGTFFPSEPISRVHGVVQVRDEQFVPMYHPAAALRQEKSRQAIIEDTRKLGQWLEDRRAAQQDLIKLEAEQVDEDEQMQLALF